MSDDGQVPLTHELLEQSQVDRLKEKLRMAESNLILAVAWRKKAIADRTQAQADLKAFEVRCETNCELWSDLAEALGCPRIPRDIDGMIAKVEEMREDTERLTNALEMIYDKWENGDPCYEHPETLDGFMGNAIKLSYEEENEILALIPREKKPAEQQDTGVAAPKPDGP